MGRKPLSKRKETIMIERQILKDIYWSDELMVSLENISTDDKCEISDYTDDELVHEARYVLSCFYEDGHINFTALIGEDEDDPCNRNWALGEVKALKKFIAKYQAQ